MEWTMTLMVASLAASFVFGITIGYFIAKHNFLSDLAAQQQEQEKTRTWVDYLKTLQGGKNE